MTKQEAKEYMQQIAEKYSAPTKTLKISAFNYWAYVENVVDGDTLDLRIDLGFKISVRERFRLLGVDTPEKYGVKKDSEEHARGVVASAFTENAIPDDRWVEVEVYNGKKGKYGRWLCQVFVNGESLNEMLLSSGNAKPLPL